MVKLLRNEIPGSPPGSKLKRKTCPVAISITSTEWFLINKDVIRLTC